MNVGDLVPIFIPARVETVDTFGVIIDIIGHKATILCNDHIEHWDISDLEKMAKWKRNALKQEEVCQKHF